MFWRSLSIMEGTVSDLSPETDLAAIIGKHLVAQNMVSGVAGSITKKISHKKLVSGSALHYNDSTEQYEEPDDDEFDEESGEEENTEE